MIPYGRQSIDQQDIDAVVSVLKSDWLTQGPLVPQFESAIADTCQANYAVATNSATSALHLAYLALGLSQGDLLWTTPITYVATSNAALYCHAHVEFVDIEPETGLMCPNTLEKKLAVANQQGRLPKIITVVHLAGQSCDMERIHKICQPYQIAIVEDASHTIGASYQDKPVGACTYSDICVFSFHPVKIMTTAEGGMALTNQKELADFMSYLRSHGVTRDPELFTEESHGDWYYQQLALGYNYRMTDIQAALGISQSQKLREFITRRNVLAERYQSAFENTPVIPLAQQQGTNAYHLYIVRLPNHEKQRKVIFSVLREAGIGVNIHYIPVHLQPYYQHLGFRKGTLPNAERFYQEIMSLPLFPALDEADQDYIIEQLVRLL